MTVGIACFIVFLIMAALMYSRKISALLALPIMAVAIALVGNVPADRILTEVIAHGSTKLANAYTTTIFGAILADLINRLGIAKAVVRFVAEFAGDSPFILGLLMTLVTALLFSSLGGLGAVIMVGTMILPVMLSLGIGAVTAGSLFLFGISLGGMFNLSNWQLYIEVLHIQREAIAAYAMPFAGCVCAIVLLFLLIELRSWRNTFWVVLGTVLLAGGFSLLRLAPSQQAATVATGQPDAHGTILVAVLFVSLALLAPIRQKYNMTALPATAYFAPALPLILVLAYSWDIIPAFLAGIAFACLATWQRDSVSTLTRSVIEGTQTVAPAVVLMLGIGMLLAAVTEPSVSGAIAPLLSKCIPTDPTSYVLVFGAFAWLSLYRGPLSLWGMGSGVVTLIETSSKLGASAIMGMLMSVGQLQGICDPTNTHNVWIATYLGVDTQTLLKRTLPYAWLAVFLGLILATALGYVR